MELFNRFRDTIFLKEDSHLQKQIEELKQLSNSNGDENIIKDIKLLEIGLKGEKEIEFELKNANIGMYVLHDIVIKHGDLRAQIDYIIITRGYTYLVECKNLIGNITVDNKGGFSREYEFNGKKYKEAIYSPYTQAVRHKEILKKIWLDSNNKLITTIRESSFDNLWYKPLVVLANSKSLLNTKYAPREIKNNIVKVDQLVRYIQNDLVKYDQDCMSSQKRMLKLANRFLDIHVEEYYGIANKYMKKEKIKRQLELFRREKAKSMNVPAYFIFTNNELNKIIEYIPKTLKELDDLHILNEVKIRCHGKEIVDILNHQETIKNKNN